jgi:putative tryptophan/tyrosine transport system substrate-binding protein
MAASGVMLAASLQVSAQQDNPQVKLVGLLVPNRLAVQQQYPVFVESLRKLGYREGENLRFVTKEAEGKLDRLPSLARELVDARVSVIVAFNTPGSRAAIDATRQIPIVMTQVGDPVSSGFVTNLARPGGNVTGTSNMVGGIAPKRMAILKEAVPSARRIAVLFNPADPVTGQQVRDAQSSAATLGVEVRLFPMRDPKELPETFGLMKAWQTHAALWLAGQHQLFQAMTITLAAQHRIPVMFTAPADVAAGGFISYTTDAGEVFRSTAAQVDRILKGAKAGDLPVEQPTKFEFAINLNTAKKLGLKIPSSMVMRADHVVK